MIHLLASLSTALAGGRVDALDSTTQSQLDSNLEGSAGSRTAEGGQIRIRWIILGAAIALGAAVLIGVLNTFVKSITSLVSISDAVNEGSHSTQAPASTARSNVQSLSCS